MCRQRAPRCAGGGRPLAWRQLLLLFALPSLAAGTWDFHGELPRWRPSFPDFDCRRSGGGGLRDAIEWDAVRRRVEAAPQDEWAAIVRVRLARVDFGAAREAALDLREPECSLGVLFAAVVRYGECAMGTLRGCSQMDLFSEVAQLLLRSTSVEVLLGTRWPLLAALGSLKLAPYFDDPQLSCEGLPAPVLDWPRLRRAFAPAADWFREAQALVYGRAFQANWVRAMEECTYGFAMVSLWKLVVCAETQAECVSQYSVLIDDLLKNNDWREVAGNGWGMFGFLARVQRAVTRHGFHLDFEPGELQGRLPGLPRRPVLPGGAAALPGEGFSASFAGVLETVLAGVPQRYLAADPAGGAPQVRHLLYVSMVFGPRYVPYIDRFVARAEALGLRGLALFCLDAAALAACAALPGGAAGRCIAGTPSILNKFTLPLAFLRLGVDVFWLDFDVFLLRDPTSRLLDIAHERQVDLLVSGSFADDCICSGLVFFRATQVVTEWLLTLLSWMYEHVYTHDQQCFSAFLAGRPDEDNATTPERISSLKLFRMYLNPEVPRWALLDPVVEFASARVLNTTGWTGDLDDMIIFHFLHGDSEVNRGHSAYGWNAMHGLAGGGSEGRALLDIFYNQSDEGLYREAAPAAYERSAEIREALLASRRPERPREMLHCGVLQLNPYTPGRMSADG